MPYFLRWAGIDGSFLHIVRCRRILFLHDLLWFHLMKKRAKIKRSDGKRFLRQAYTVVWYVLGL